MKKLLIVLVLGMVLASGQTTYVNEDRTFAGNLTITEPINLINSTWRVLGTFTAYASIDGENSFILGSQNAILRLSKGWNLISLPTDATYTAEQFLTKTECTLIAKYDGGIQTHIKGTSNFNFNVTHGRGYYMYCLQDNVVEIEGTYVSTTPTNLKLGWNLIGSSNASTAEELCGSITHCIAVAAYDHGFNVYTAGEANNFMVATDKGYFVYVTENSNWTITCA